MSGGVPKLDYPPTNTQSTKRSPLQADKSQTVPPQGRQIRKGVPSSGLMHT